MVIKRKTSAFRRKQIAAAAAKLIVVMGGEHVTIKNIAREIGLSEAAIYKHFPDKMTIYSFLIEYSEKILLADLSYEKYRRTCLKADVDFLIQRHIYNVVKRRGIFFQVFTEVISMGNRKLNQEAFKAINNYIAHMGYLIKTCDNSRYFNMTGDPPSSAFIFYSLLQFLVNTWTLSGYSFNLQNRFDSIWFKCGIAHKYGE